MEILHYPINVVNDLQQKIVECLSEDVKNKLMPLKKENSFTIYNQPGQNNSSNNVFNQNKSYEIRTTKSNYHTQNQPFKNRDEKQTLKDTDKEETENIWRSSSALVSRPSLNPNDNVKKKELFLLLNKISESNFQVITKQLISLIKEGDEVDNVLSSLLISRLFQSAMIQVSFCPIYAKMCSNLILELDSQRVHDELDQKITKQINSMKDYSSSMELSDYESFCDDVAFKNKYIGCYHFITELLNYKCLSFDKLIEVIQDLSDNIESLKDSIKIDILVESICKIYQSVDKRMLQEEQIVQVDNHIKTILETSKSKMSSRAKYIFEDVLEKQVKISL